MLSFSAVIAMEQRAPNLFVGPCFDSVIPRTFGGQVAAQALQSAQLFAAQTLGSDKLVESGHFYFVGPGDSSLPIEFRVELLRDGRSFDHYEVRGYQEGQLIVVLTALSHLTGELGPEHFTAMPQVPGPDDVAPGIAATPASSRALLEEWGEWDIRAVPSGSHTTPGFRYFWFRNRGDVVEPEPRARVANEAELHHRAALTYMSDMTLIHAALQATPGAKVQMASLDHTIWFHRPARVDQWLLYQQYSHSSGRATGLAEGKLYQHSGELVASVVQHGLLRTLRDGATAVPQR